MLSARGATSTGSILAEVVDSQPPSLRKVLLLTDTEKVWGALCRVLRAQLIQGHHVVLPGRTCGFHFKSRQIVKDGDVKYSARTPFFGFHPAFITKFSLDTNIPREESKECIKLPLEYVADECKMSTEFVSTLLHEIFLFIGEALFRGRLLRLEFEGLASVLVKREKAIVTMDSGFLGDIFAIDSRKWPSTIKDLAAPVMLRPQSAATTRPRSSSSTRPTSAGSRPASSSRPPSAGPTPRPASSNQPLIETPRAAFVSAASTGKLFADLKKVRPRVAPKERPPTGGRRQPLQALPKQGQGYGEEQRPTSCEHCHPTEFQQQPPALLGDVREGEEESIYSVLSPSRHQDPMASAPYTEGEFQRPPSGSMMGYRPGSGSSLRPSSGRPMSGGRKGPLPEAAGVAPLDTFQEGEVGVQVFARPSSGGNQPPQQQYRPQQYYQPQPQDENVYAAVQPPQQTEDEVDEFGQPAGMGRQQYYDEKVAAYGEEEEGEEQEGVLGFGVDSKHVHFRSPKSSQQQQPADAAVEPQLRPISSSSSNFYMGDSAPPPHAHGKKRFGESSSNFFQGETAPPAGHHPAGGRKRVAATASLASVRSLLTGQ